MNFMSVNSFFFILFIVNNLIVQVGFGQTKVFFLGHSLINFNVPNMTNRLAEAANKGFILKRNIGNGANLSFHYTNPFSPGSQGDVWKNTLTDGDFTDFVFTEAIPLKGHLQWSKTHEYADSFAIYFRNYNEKGRIFLYETWHCIKSGTPQGCEWEEDDKDPWTTRLKNDFALWNGILNYLKTKGHGEVFMVPAGQAFIKLDEEIKKGNLSGIENVFDLFSDDIHLTNIGNYFIACLMYGVIFKESPLGLPSRLKDEYDVFYTVFPTDEQARVLQNVAWQTLCEIELSGINCTTASFQEPVDEISTPKLENGIVYFKTKMDVVEVYTIDGKKILSCKSCNEIKLSSEYKNLHIIKMRKGDVIKSKKLFSL